MGKINGSKWEYYALETRLLVRCQNKDKIEVLTGTKNNLHWIPAIEPIEEIARMIPKNAILLNSEEDAKDLYLRQIEHLKH